MTQIQLLYCFVPQASWLYLLLAAWEAHIWYCKQLTFCEVGEWRQRYYNMGRRLNRTAETSQWYQWWLVSRIYGSPQSLLRTYPLWARMHFRSVMIAWTLPTCSLVPRPLPDFILQLWSCEIISGSGLGTRLIYLSVDPVIRTDLLNFRQVTGPVIKESAPRLSSLQVCNFTYRILAAFEC